MNIALNHNITETVGKGEVFLRAYYNTEMHYSIFFFKQQVLKAVHENILTELHLINVFKLMGSFSY